MGMAPCLCRMLQGEATWGGRTIQISGTLAKSSLPPDPAGHQVQMLGGLEQYQVGAEGLTSPSQPITRDRFGMVCSAGKLREQPRPQAAEGPLVPPTLQGLLPGLFTGPRRLRHTGTVRGYPTPPGTPHTQAEPSHQSSVAGSCSPPHDAPFCSYVGCTMGFPSGSVGKESACSEGATGGMLSIPGLGRSPGGGHGNPL